MGAYYEGAEGGGGRRKSAWPVLQIEFTNVEINEPFDNHVVYAATIF